MGLFSDINGFNEKAIKSFEIKNAPKEDFAEVDFCQNDDLFDSPKASFVAGDQEKLENFMYNFELTEAQARDYMNKNLDIEG